MLTCKKPKTTAMNISYSGPLSSGWVRMKKALFQPFDIAKWINIGFTAFLAGLTDCNGGGNGGNKSGLGNHNDWDDFFNFPQTAWDWLTGHPLWFNLIILGIILLFVIGIVLTWLSSRGKFMFLHNVIHNKDDVKKPWYEFKTQGNSLFWWRFFFGWIAFLAFISYFIFCYTTAKNMYYGEISVGPKVWIIAGLIILFLALIIIVGYISLFLNDFVVPIMYKHRISATRAWLKFLQLMGIHFGTFIIYGLFIFVLGIAVGIGVIFLALITCCIGLLLLAIPFVGSVILLPVSYTFRALSIEFLRQFGEEFDVFPSPETMIIEETAND